ncbi:MAG TPA: efflux RND transporter periplasmic adaptor subunit [Chromatiales bacterium]|nr:efflux RND transporter periplasmic adaptor subunit [Thiotrichales bacterium]HIP68193.1 efflux RND transporter periplasmic adaptor subunit [Chromatiales bacterium]
MHKLIALVTVMAAVITGAHADEALPFATLPVVKQDVPKIQVLDGTVEAVNQTTVSAQTSGQVVEILYDVDDFVEEGAIIARLQAKEQTAGLKESRANLAEAQARVKQMQQNYDRIKGIYDRKLVARSKLDAASAELNAAKARLSAARAAMTKAEKQVDYTQVRAPYSGIVTERHVELGEYVNVGKPLVTGLSLDQLRVSVNVPQRLINNVRKFKTAFLLSFDNDPVGKVKGLTFFPYAEPQTRTFKVRVNLEDKTPDLFPGMFVKVGFVTGKMSRLVVPVSAIAYRGEVTAVYVVDSENKPHLRQVRLGSKANHDMVIVLAGLQEGETVALDPVAAGIYLKQLTEKAHD